jgi:hypothetical protein
MMKPLMGAVVIGLGAACETGPAMTTNVEVATGFTRYHTYEWVCGDAPRAVDQALHDSVRDAIERELAAKGYQPSETPDFAVSFTLDARANVDVYYGPYSFYPGYDPHPSVVYADGYDRSDVRAYTDGTLAIDVFDAQTGDPIWNGVAADQLGSGGATQEQLEKAVAALLEQFPPT